MIGIQRVQGLIVRGAGCVGTSDMKGVLYFQAITLTIRMTGR
jgi:hypothetical protein